MTVADAPARGVVRGRLSRLGVGGVRSRRSLLAGECVMVLAAVERHRLGGAGYEEDDREDAREPAPPGWRDGRAAGQGESRHYVQGSLRRGEGHLNVTAGAGTLPLRPPGRDAVHGVRHGRLTGSGRSDRTQCACIASAMLRR